MKRGKRCCRDRFELLETRRLLAFQFAESLNDPSTVLQANARFGWSVSTGEEFTVVGSPYEDLTAARDAGKVYVYENAENTLVGTLVSPKPVAGENFGWSIALAGSQIVVGTQRENAEGAYLFDAETGQLLNTFRPPHDPPLRFSTRFGASLATDGELVVVGAPHSDVGARDAGSAFVFDATNGELVFAIDNPEPGVSDQFGNAVSIRAEGILIGAHLDDHGADNTGSAYLFDRDTGNLAHTYRNPTPEEDDQFGFALSTTSSITAISARFDSTQVAGAGAVYVFDNTTKQLTHSVFAPEPTASDEFGYQIAVHGPQLLVGSHRDDTGAIDAGSAYLFDLNSVQLQQIFSNPEPAPSDNFATALGIAGQRIVIGAWRDSPGVSGAGSAYVFDASTGQLTTTLANASLGTDNRFGASRAVALTAGRLVVGARFDDYGATDSGAAYVFPLADGEPARKLMNPEPQANDAFGFSVAMNDHYTIVGAPGDQVNGLEHAGRAFLFDPDTAALGRQFENPSASSFDQFGWSVAISGQHVAIGAPFDNIDRGDSAIVDAGSVFVFDVETGELVQSVLNPSPGPNEEFGYSLALHQGRLVVGSRTDDEDAPNGGSAFLFDLDTFEPTRLFNPTPRSGDEFGRAVAIDDQYIAVGAPADLSSKFLNGSVTLYDAKTGELLNTIHNPESVNRFGHAVSLRDGYLLVGAPEQDTGAINAGTAYLYEASSGELLDTFRNPSPDFFDQFGSSLAIGDRLLAIGAPGEDGATINRGAVHLFRDSDAPPDPNRPPVTAQDQASTSETERVAVDVIANDDDPNVGDLLTVVAASAQIVAATDFRGNPVSLTTATLRQSNREIIFDPGTDFTFLQSGEAATVYIDFVVTDDGLPPMTAASQLVVHVTGRDSTQSLPGDFNLDGILTAADIDLFFAEMRAETHDPFFDLNEDQSVDEQDRDILVLDLFNSTYGDSNLDGIFDSSDLLLVFQAGEFQDDRSINSTWEAGDWTGDGEFDTGDLVLAFQQGDYQV